MSLVVHLRIVLLTSVLVSIVPAQSLAPFANVTASSTINIPAYGGAGNGGHYRGAAWADFDNDGDLDLFAPGSVNSPIWLSWNNGNGTFTRTVIWPASSMRADHGCVAADFDNDGDQVVYVAVGNWQPNLLFVNDGMGGFTEEAAIRGVAWSGDSYSVA